MKNSTLTNDTLSLTPHPTATLLRSVAKGNPAPVNRTEQPASWLATHAVAIQAVLGVLLYAGGLFTLAWWELAHPSFWLLLAGAGGVIIGAKLFLFPSLSRSYDDLSRGTDFSNMLTMSEYLNPHALDPASNDEQHQLQPVSMKKNINPNNFELLISYKL